jgi:rSAM/selenodomain-associated transferase 2
MNARAPCLAISVIVPTFNAGQTLARTLDALAAQRAALIREIVISEGGSDDETVTIAEEYGCKVVRASKGRGAQLRHGASVASGDWLLFLHADTRMTDNWADVVSEFATWPNAIQSAGVFRFRLDDERTRARLLEIVVSIRSRLLAMPYGDQGLFVSRQLYDEIGGFSQIPLMEDVDIIRRIGRRRLTILPADAVTSADRYRREGYLRRSARNVVCLALYFLGVSPSRIARLYG